MLLILYVGTQLASGYFMSVTADKSQRTMMFLLPLIFVPFILNFPAGLILYWITTNFWTIGQGLAVKKIIPAPVAATPEGAAAIAAAKPPASNRPKRRSGGARSPGWSRRVGYPSSFSTCSGGEPPAAPRGW